jgi:transitional endoplasmic reticulum ATPase
VRAVTIITMTINGSLAHGDQTAREYFHHSSAQRVNTDVVLTEALRKQYPNLDLVVAPRGGFDLLAYASAGYATAKPIEDAVNDPVYGAALSYKTYIPPARRLDNSAGFMAEQVIFGKYLYKWKDQENIVYIASTRDGTLSYPAITNHYILTRETHKTDELIKEATLWGSELHNEVWVYDQGFWQKSAELYNSVQKSNWEDVILDEDMKKHIIHDVENFFDSQETYKQLKVPWKRGIIYYGPPGNGKTISIKAMMHTLYQRGAKGNTKMSVPTLYVRTLASYAGPEYSLRSIFAKARQAAPCYLVFEDLDSIVNDRVRSYFLNEVDGIRSNDGILMVGSTNHLDRLDPGIAKRPSRFDRKYYFSDPDYAQRIQYAHFWQGKLKDNKDIDFPDKLCPAIAKITENFSFAYMQEAFVATLLAIAGRNAKGGQEAEEQARYWAGSHDPMTAVYKRAAGRSKRTSGGDGDPELDKYVLWKEMQIQVKILREEMDEKSGRSEVPLALRGRGPLISSDDELRSRGFRDGLDEKLHGANHAHSDWPRDFSAFDSLMGTNCNGIDEDVKRFEEDEEAVAAFIREV